MDLPPVTLCALIAATSQPTKVVVGTSLFQIIFVTGFTTLMHATQNFTVDAVLALLLLLGGVVGAIVAARHPDRVRSLVKEARKSEAAAEA